MRRKRLLITEIDSVGAVDEPDNPPASLLFWKRHRETPDVGDVNPEGVSMDVEEEVGKAVEEVAEPVAEAVVEAEGEPEGEVVKSEAVAKAVAERDEAIAKAAEAERRLTEEIEKRQQVEWVEKAKPFELLIGPSETFGPVLRKIAVTCPDEYPTLEEGLRAAVAKARLAEVVSEKGTSAGGVDPLAQREAFVKAHPELKAVEAAAEFWRLHPEAVEAVREGA